MLQKSNKNKTIIAVIIFVVICIGTFLLLTNIITSGGISEQEQTSNEVAENSTIFSTKVVENPDTKTVENSSSNIEQKIGIVQNEGSDPNKSNILTGTLTTSRVSGNYLVIRVNIDQFLTYGTCSLSLVSDSKTITKTANIIPNTSTATCEGFDIPTNELSSGNWMINIDIDSDNKNGSITGEVNI